MNKSPVKAFLTERATIKDFFWNEWATIQGFFNEQAMSKSLLNELATIVADTALNHHSLAHSKAFLESTRHQQKTFEWMSHHRRRLLMNKPWTKEFWMNEPPSKAFERMNDWMNVSEPPTTKTRHQWSFVRVTCLFWELSVSLTFGFSQYEGGEQIRLMTSSGSVKVTVLVEAEFDEGL